MPLVMPPGHSSRVPASLHEFEKANLTPQIQIMLTTEQAYTVGRFNGDNVAVSFLPERIIQKNPYLGYPLAPPTRSRGGQTYIYPEKKGYSIGPRGRRPGGAASHKRSAAGPSPAAFAYFFGGLIFGDFLLTQSSDPHRNKFHIPYFDLAGRVHPFHCASFPTVTRCAGLAIGFLSL